MNNLSKTLKIIKDSEVLDGFTFVYKRGYVVNINVEKLWNDSKRRAPVNTVDAFIKNFCKTMEHEHLHVAIGRSYTNWRGKYDIGEEKTVWGLTKEKLSKASLKYYIEEYYKK